jgi:Acyl-CoA dehydrogenase, N-terminal domain
VVSDAKGAAVFRLDADPAQLPEAEGERQLRYVLREFFTEVCGPEGVRAQADSPRGHDRLLWERLAGEIGLHGPAVSEECGGVGFTFAELAVALEEAGRSLCPAPLPAARVLAANALLCSGDRRACERRLPAIAECSLTATVAGFLQPGDVTAERGPSGWSPRGQADFVPDGVEADLLVVAARAPDGCSPAGRTPRRATARGGGCSTPPAVRRSCASAARLPSRWGTRARRPRGGWGRPPGNWAAARTRWKRSLTTPRNELGSAGPSARRARPARRCWGRPTTTGCGSRPAL